jgi:hypothetical protein
MVAVKLWCKLLLAPSYVKCISVLQVLKPSKMQSLGKCCAKLVSSKLKLSVMRAFHRFVCMCA